MHKPCTLKIDVAFYTKCVMLKLHESKMCAMTHYNDIKLTLLTHQVHHSAEKLSIAYNS